MIARLASFFNTKIILCLILVAGCSGSDEPRISVAVGAFAGHTHNTDFTYRGLKSGIRTFRLFESSGHDHTVTLTDTQTALILAGIPQVVESTSNQLHTHSVLLQEQKE